MSEKREYICLLGINPKEVKKCNASECPTCGWEAAEAERRRAYLHECGLTLCADGLRRLIIPKNGGNEEMKYKVCDHTSGIADLRLVGINVPENAGSSSETLGDPLLDRAIILYAKSEDNFGGEGERHRKAYDYLK